LRKRGLQSFHNTPISSDFSDPFYPPSDGGESESNMNAVNTEAVSSIMQDQNAERVKAERDYHEIAFDATRNSDQDKADLALALKILGKTPDDVRADHAAVTKSYELAAAASGHEEAKKATDDAKEALDEFLRRTRPAMLNQIEQLEQQHRNALNEANSTQVRILASLLLFRRHVLLHGRLKGKHLAPEPAGSPAEIRINGEYCDPAQGPNPRTGF
jgi:hypothetical protein